MGCSHYDSLIVKKKKGNPFTGFGYTGTYFVQEIERVFA
jgi:hypothetical protein